MRERIRRFLKGLGYRECETGEGVTRNKSNNGDQTDLRWFGKRKRIGRGRLVDGELYGGSLYSELERAQCSARNERPRE